MKALFKYYMDCGRMGELEGIFIADVKEVLKLKGREIDLGEVLGKHSQVTDESPYENVKLITADNLTVSVVEKHGLEMGINPLDYISED